MSHPSDNDRELEAFLARESALQKHWREAADEAPPPQLDADVRAAARRAVGTAPRDATTGSRGRWRVPLAAAATVVLGTTLALMVAEREAHIPDAAVERATQPVPSARDDAPALASDAEEQAAPVPPEAANARTRESASEAKQRGVRPSPAPTPPADSTPAGETPPAAAREAPESRSRIQSFSKRIAPSPPAAEGASAQEIERLLRQIRTLRDEGRFDEAAQRLHEFRQRYPDYEVPVELTSDR